MFNGTLSPSIIWATANFSCFFLFRCRLKYWRISPLHTSSSFIHFKHIKNCKPSCLSIHTNIYIPIYARNHDSSPRSCNPIYHKLWMSYSFIIHPNLIFGFFYPPLIHAFTSGSTILIVCHCSDQVGVSQADLKKISQSTEKANWNPQASNPANGKFSKKKIDNFHLEKK